MRIGDLARRSGVSARAIRHYEKAGLLASRRAENGYRDFTPDAADRVAQIRLLLDHGFGVRDARALLGCVDALARGAGPCAAALAGYERKLRELEERIAALSQVRDRARAALRSLHRRDRRQRSPP